MFSDMKSLCLTLKLFHDLATPRLYSTACVQSWNPQCFDSFFKSYESGASVHFQKTSALVVEDEKPPAEPLLDNKSAPIEGNRKLCPNPDDLQYKDATREDEKPFIGPRSNLSRGSLRFHYDVRQWPLSMWPSYLERDARLERAVQAFTNTERLRSFRCVLIMRLTSRPMLTKLDPYQDMSSRMPHYYVSSTNIYVPWMLNSPIPTIGRLSTT
jgi:hypothetical protein